jgi:hypothetical protein
MLSPASVSALVCVSGSRSGLEYALRLAVAEALDVPVSAVLVDALRTPNASTTQVSKMREILAAMDRMTIHGLENGEGSAVGSEA